jgi:hypothetical protein
MSREVNEVNSEETFELPDDTDLRPFFEKVCEVASKRQEPSVSWAWAGRKLMLGQQGENGWEVPVGVLLPGIFAVTAPFLLSPPELPSPERITETTEKLARVADGASTVAIGVTKSMLSTDDFFELSEVVT